MKKDLKGIATFTCCALAMGSAFVVTSCNKQATKIGVLVSDKSTAEALGFMNYYQEYIADQYDVEFVYSDELANAAEEKSAIESMVASNCKAVISFSSFDREAQIKQCEKEKVYYSVATGTLTAEQYEAYKGYDYYVGSIGPDNDTEFNTGYNMAKYYINKGMKKFGIFGGAVPYYTEMHIYRVAGMLTAMVESGGADASYGGEKVKEAIVGKIYTDGCQINTGSIGDIELLSYVGGYAMDEPFWASCAAAVNEPGLEAFLAVGNGSDFFAASKPATVQLASVDAYAKAYGDAMQAGSLNYLAGKFSSSIGPIFLATLRAVNGKKLTTAEGNALALGQGYWVSTSYDDFTKYQNGDTASKPAYTKEILDKYLDADYQTFASFVEKYSFEEITNLGK